MLSNIGVSLNTLFSTLNNSKYFSGIMMLLLNVGGKQVSNEISSFQENILNHKVVRRLLVFVVVFIATKDVKISLIVTICFIIIVTGFFNEESKYCVIPKDKVGNTKKILKE
tara:strand:- start:334 stop:669 length:336 start_codon:yes stop_codon:yes gene_type:complete